MTRCREALSRKDGLDLDLVGEEGCTFSRRGEGVVERGACNAEADRSRPKDAISSTKEGREFIL